MITHTISPQGIGSVSTYSRRASVPMAVTPLTISQGGDDNEIDSIMQDIQSDDECLEQEDLIEKIRVLQVIVKKI